MYLARCRLRTVVERLQMEFYRAYLEKQQKLEVGIGLTAIMTNGSYKKITCRCLVQLNCAPLYVKAGFVPSSTLT